MTSLLNYLRLLTLALIAVFVAAVLAELPPLPAIASWIQEREWQLMIVTGSVGVLGFTLMMGGILKLLMDQDESLSHADVEDVERSVRMAARPVACRATSYRVWGRATGREGSDEFTFRAMKQAWRNGAWRRETVWRRRYLTALGALLMTIGLFGLGFTLTPPPIKVLTGGALLYAMGMISWGFWKA